MIGSDVFASTPCSLFRNMVTKQMQQQALPSRPSAACLPCPWPCLPLRPTERARVYSRAAGPSHSSDPGPFGDQGARLMSKEGWCPRTAGVDGWCRTRALTTAQSAVPAQRGSSIQTSMWTSLCPQSASLGDQAISLVSRRPRPLSQP